jgi:hypothetical protein
VPTYVELAALRGDVVAKLVRLENERGMLDIGS